MKPIFISCADSTATVHAASTIVGHLEAKGLACFFAARDVARGAGHGATILSALKECALVLLVVSRDMDGSEQVLTEIDAAVSSRKSVLPVFIEDVVLNNDFRYYIGRKQWVIAYPGALDTYLEKIYRMVSECIPEECRTNPPRQESAPIVKPPISHAAVSEPEGPFAFISYAHADSAAVIPIVTAMQRAGICVWYDNGIEAGSEWPEYIAQKVASCTKFVSFISGAYLSSQNCKRELNFAVSRGKELLSVYLEKVELSLGMEMQLGTYQAMFRERFATLEQFTEALCRERFFAVCREAK